MHYTLFRHNWLKGIRAPGYYKNLIVNIFIGLMSVYFIIAFIILGFALPEILSETLPHLDPALTFNGILPYILLAALFIRFMFQQLSVINLQSYQTLPIKREKIVNYLLLKPLLNPANYFTLCFVIPFAVSAVSKYYDGWTAFGFVWMIIFFIWFNTLTASFLKRKFGSNFVTIFIFLVVIGGFGLLEYFNIFSLFRASQHFFHFLLENTFGWIFALIFPVSAFLLNKWHFSQNYYAENFDRKIQKKAIESHGFTFMERFGKIGEIIALEIKLIMRNKRTKNVLYTAAIFLLYGLLFYPMETYKSNYGLLFFVATFVTGTGMLMFGQWIFSWDGVHFDFLMTRDIDTHTYIRANYFLLLGLSVISFIITTPYFFFGQQIILYHLVAFLYNTGVNINIFLFANTFNTTRLELSKGSAMNFQGTTWKNFIIILPILILPMILIGVLSFFSATNIALIILATLGLLGIFFQKPLLRITESQFLRRKYALCDGYRKKE